MKNLIKFIIALTISASAFGTSTLTCKSANYAIEVTDSFARYSINGRDINGPEVFLEDLYLSERVIALSLNVDSQPKLIEISVAKDKAGVLRGTLFFGKTSQIATCKRI